MFLCEPCHDLPEDHINHGCTVQAIEMRSHGPCEGCGEVKMTTDCHYTSPAVEAAVADVLRRGSQGETA